MKKIFYFLLIGLVPFLASCDKETVYTINKSGSLTIKVVDSDGNGIDKAKIDLRLSGETLFYDSTDVSGVYKSEEMLEGIYRCYVSVTRNGLVYNSNQYVQVIAGQNKHVEINPFGDSKKISVGLSNYYNDAPVMANVLICPQINATLDEYKELAYFSGKTTAAGQFAINEIPYGSYNVVFYDDNDKILRNDYMYVNKDGSPEFKFHIYISTITVKLVNYYNDAPFTTPYNVLVVPGWGNSLDEYKESAVAQGKTNAGTVVFENIVSPYENYHYQIVFYDDNNNIVKEEGVYVEESTPEFNFYMYASTVTVQLVNYYNDAPLASLNVLLVRNWMNSLEEYKQHAVAQGKTNAQGSVVFENLVSFYNGYSYHVIAYNDDDQVQVDDYIYISQASESFTLGVWWWDY